MKPNAAAERRRKSAALKKEQQAAAQDGPAWTQSQWLWPIVLFVLTLIAYLPALRAGFIWDDDDYVTNNLTLRTLAGLRQIWFELGATPQYYPLVHTTFWLEYRFWGLNPAGFHLVNILLHATGAWLLWRVLRGFGLPLAWFASALFALHPVEVESVAWVTERKNVLCGVFYFASALAYLRFLGHDVWQERAGNQVAGSADEAALCSRRKLWYVSALLFFAAALLSKTVACSLPAALLVVIWWRRGRLAWRDAGMLLPFFALGLALSLITVWMEKHHVGASGKEFSLTFIDRCLIAGRALWFYAAKLIAPVNLVFIYPRWSIDAHAAWQYIFPVAALAVIAALWLSRNRLGRGPLAAALFYAGTLFPALGFINVFPMQYSFVADHFQYLAGVGLIVLFASGVVPLIEKAVGRQVVLAGCLAIMGLLGLLSFTQTYIYRDLDTLWRDTIARNNGAGIAHNNLGNLLADKAKLLAERNERDKALAQYQAAFTEYEAALKIRPDDDYALYNYGHTLSQIGKTDEAIARLLEAIRVNPKYVDAMCVLAMALADKGEFAAAGKWYAKSLEIYPGSVAARNNYAVVLTKLGRYDEAIAQCMDAIRLSPGFAMSYSNLANVWSERKRPDLAAEWLEKGSKAAPGDADLHFQLAVKLAEMKKDDAAISQFKTAIQLDPNSADAHYNLANMLAKQGKPAEAVEHYQMAIQANPADAEAYQRLGQQLDRMGKSAEAQRAFQHAANLRQNGR